MIAGINLDMVGQNQELCRSTLNLDRTPDSLPSYLNDFVFSLVEHSVKEFSDETHFGSGSTFRYNTTVFSGGSDHAEFTEATIGVPCVMLLQWPDLFYHTSEDTIDKVSEDSLKRVGWITTVAAVTLANATHEDIFLFANQAASRGVARIAEASRVALQLLLKKEDDPKNKERQVDLARELVKTANYHKSKIEHIVWREQHAVRSVRRLGEHPELTVSLDKQCEDIASLGKRETAKIEEALNFIAKMSAVKLPAQLEETQAELEAKKLVPRRLFKGTLSGDHFKRLLGEEEYRWYTEIDEKDAEFNKKMPEILNFMNGKRNAHEIVKAVSAEYTPTDIEYVLKFLKDLEKTKLITFNHND
jgi:hypothetical protein